MTGETIAGAWVAQIEETQMRRETLLPLPSDFLRVTVQAALDEVADGRAEPCVHLADDHEQDAFVRPGSGMVGCGSCTPLRPKGAVCLRCGDPPSRVALALIGHDPTGAAAVLLVADLCGVCALIEGAE